MVHAASEFTYELEERFIRYARIDTQSDEKSTTSPSTEKQYELLRLLVDELTSSGAHDIKLTDGCFVVNDFKAHRKYNVFFLGTKPETNTGVSFEGVGYKQDPHCQQGQKVQVLDWKPLEGERRGSAERIIVRPGTREQCASQVLRRCERPVDLQPHAGWLYRSQRDQLRESDLYCGPPSAPPGRALQLRRPEDGSLWAGYNFSAGQKLVLNITPMLGGVFGRTTGIAPGCEASLTYQKFQLSISSEYVFDTREYGTRKAADIA